MNHCGRSTCNWTPAAVYDLTCPSCGEEVEFFKDDRRRRCPACRTEILNPHYSPGCAGWCQGAVAGLAPPEPPAD
jgi:DNA-directed RNA polymerase subunit RPC12/RpoP